MRDRDFWSERRVTGILLCLALPIGVIGVIDLELGAGVSFTGDPQPGAPLEQQFTIIKNLISPALTVYGFGRLLIGVLAPIVALLGFTLLTQVLRDAGARVLPSLGLICYAVATVFVVFHEMNAIAVGREEQGEFAGLYTVLAFSGQAVYGAALLRTALLPRWLGWLTIVYNVGWFAGFYVLNYPYGPGYYPLWNLIMPFVIGTALALQGDLRVAVPRAGSSTTPTSN
jgi:hypothetical protein